MTALGIIESQDAFWHIILNKWKEYLHRLSSGRHLTEIIGKEIDTEEDLKTHFEDVKTYMRGHNLYDIFYGPFKHQESELLKQYIDLAPREDFQDILDAVEGIGSLLHTTQIFLKDLHQGLIQTFDLLHGGIPWITWTACICKCRL